MDSEATAADDGMPRPIGATLAAARAARGLDLADVARDTRVPVRHLAAIEADAHDGLPALPYAIGFVKAFARAVGVDPDLAGSQFRAETSKAAHVPAAPAMVPLDERRLPPRGLVAASLVALAVVVAGVVAWSAGMFDAAPPATPVTVAAAPPAPKTAVSAGSEAATPDVSAAGSAAAPPTAVAKAGATSPGPPAGQSSAVAPPPAGAPAAAAIATTPPAGPIAGSAVASPPVAGSSAAAPSVARPAALSPGTTLPGAAPPATVGAASGVVITASDDAWFKVSVYDPAARKVVTVKTGVLAKGERYVPPATPGLRLWTGRAGALRITVDGRAIPPLGGPVETVKNVSLDASDLRARVAPAAGAAR